MVRLPRRLRSESGVALVIALLVLAGLAAGLTTVIMVGTSSGNTAVRASADQQAYDLAEAGINSAMAELHASGVNALDPTALPAPPPDPSAHRDDYSTGHVLWGGTLDTSTGIWTITSIGYARNPAGPNLPDRYRKLTGTSTVLASLTQPLNAQAWNYIYSTRTGTSGGCDQTLVNTVAIRAPLYVTGNFCLYNSASVQVATTPPSPAPAVNVLVQGQIKTYNTSFLGTSSQKLNQVLVANGCNGHNPCKWNGGGDPVWANTVSSTPPTVTPPTANFDYWYQNASPGPMHACSTVSGTPPTFDNDTTRNTSVPGTVDLTPTASYTCQTSSGELSWNATTKVLTVKGAIFIDGNVTASYDGTLQYDGQASLYVNGTFGIGNLTEICGGIKNGLCDFGSWDPNSQLLLLVVNGTAGGSADYGVTFTNSSMFQGGVYATHAVEFANSAQQEGPLVASYISFANSVQAEPFPVITTVPVGTPGNPNVYADAQPPVIAG